MRIAPCWSCGGEGECYEGCVCAKCLDPEGYEEWRYNNPEEYSDWLEREADRYERGEYGQT